MPEQPPADSDGKIIGDVPWKFFEPPRDTPAVHVIREMKLVGGIVLDPACTPPWPGAGIISVRDAGSGDTPGEQQVSTDPGPGTQ